MAAKIDTRIHPITAYRAVRALLRDREDTRQVFVLMDALRGKTTLRQLQRFRRSETGRRLLAEHSCLLDRLNQRERLAQLPRGTLGREYHEFMAAEELSADGLVAASGLREKPLPDSELTWFRERSREMHDLLHIVSGYGRDPLGEACLAAFSCAQTGLKGFAVIAAFAARRISRACPGFPIKRAIFNGWRRGRRAAWLVGADWEALLDQPVEAVRAQFAVPPAKYYSEITAALRPAAGAPAADPAPRAPLAA